MSAILRFRLYGLIQKLGDTFIAYRAWTTGPKLIMQALHTEFRKSFSPLPNRFPRHLDLVRNVNVLRSFGSQ